MNSCDTSTPHPRNAWARLSAVLDRIARNDPHGARDILEGLRHHPRLDDEILAIFDTQVRRALGAGRHVPRINLPSDYLRNADHRWRPPFRRLETGRSVPQPYPPEMVLPDLPGQRNDTRFLEDAAAALFPGGRAGQVHVHVVLSPRDSAAADRMLDQIAGQEFPGRVDVTLFSGGHPLRETGRGAGGGGRFRALPHHVLSREAQPDLRRIAEECDLVVFLDGEVDFDDLLLLRLGWHAGISERLVQPLTEQFRGGDSPTAFSRSVAATRFRSRYPFREMQGLNMAAPAALLRRVGPPDCRFEDSFHAARELAFRMFNAGCYFAPSPVRRLAGISDQEAHSADAALYRRLCPNHWDRKKDARFDVPRICIYIPAYNASRYLSRAIDSVLDQDVQDLEVCVANDGSTDGTADLLRRRYGDNPRVRWCNTLNGGIGHASNHAIALSNSLYIGQLDSDDMLKPGAVRRLADYLDENPEVVCVYSSCERVDDAGRYLKDEYSWPEFSREKMMITSIAHHFRMFRRYAWNRTSGFRTDIVNAVDYDIFLKLCETGQFHHIEEILYQRRWHGENTSSVNEHHQTANTHRVQREALKRLGLSRHWDVHVPDPEEPRRVSYRLRDDVKMVLFWPDYSYSNPYQKLLYHHLRARHEVLAADIDAALEVIGRRECPPAITFHLHWLNFLFADIDDTDAARARADAFAAKLESYKRQGGRLIWTVHNAASHDSPFRDIEADLSARIAALADVLHFHCEGSVEEAARTFAVPTDKVRVSRHGHYIGCYPDYVPRAAARRALGIAPGDDVLLFAGQLRPYKGVELLIAAFRRILAERPQALLVLAGAKSFDPFEELARPLDAHERARIRITDRFIDDAELQLFFGAADVAVYPYRNILTSGSMMLALGFGTPVVVPEVAMTREVLAGHDAGVLYDPDGGEAALETGVRAVLARKDRGELRAMQVNARRRAEMLTWPDFTGVVDGEPAADREG